jgi:uncharacterized membrane protein
MTAERVRALEVQQDGTNEKLHSIEQRLASIDSKLERIDSGLSRQKGYIAGAMSVIVVIWTAILSAIAVLWDKLVESFGTLWP